MGTPIACPTCNTTVIVPNETTGTAGGSTPTTSSPALSADNATTGQKTSGLAIASLVCSLSSLITCVGWLPGIICGHLAKSHLRRNPSLKGNGLATAGLVIGYLILLLEAGTAAVQMWRISTAVKHGFDNVQQSLATNQIIVTQTQSTTVSNDNEPAAPAKESAGPATVAAVNPPIAPSQSGWTADISKVSFPGHPVSGKLHGLDFTIKTAAFRNGGLRIRSADGLQLDVYRLGDSIEGRSFEIRPDDDYTASPRVKITWSEGDAVQTVTFNKGFGMKLQFDPAINRTVSGKIYLCLPDDVKSCVAGTFEVKLPKPK
jgi:hypothetical protein